MQKFNPSKCKEHLCDNLQITKYFYKYLLSWVPSIVQNAHPRLHYPPPQVNLAILNLSISTLAFSAPLSPSPKPSTKCLVWTFKNLRAHACLSCNSLRTSYLPYSRSTRLFVTWPLPTSALSQPQVLTTFEKSLISDIGTVWGCDERREGVLTGIIKNLDGNLWEWFTTSSWFCWYLCLYTRQSLHYTL